MLCFRLKRTTIGVGKTDSININNFLQKKGMAHFYKRTTNRQAWTNSELVAARHEVGCGVSVRAAAAKYGIPSTVLIRRIADPPMKMKMGVWETVFRTIDFR